MLPALRPHQRLLLRTVVLGRKKANNRMHVLVSEKTAAHLPVADINPVRSIHSTLKRFLTEIFGADIPQHKVGFAVKVYITVPFSTVHSQRRLRFKYEDLSEYRSKEGGD